MKFILDTKCILFRALLEEFLAPAAPDWEAGGFVLNADRPIGLLCNPVRISPQAHLAAWQGLFTGGEAGKKGAYRTCETVQPTSVCGRRKGRKGVRNFILTRFSCHADARPVVGAGDWVENKTNQEHFLIFFKRLLYKKRKKDQESVCSAAQPQPHSGSQ